MRKSNARENSKRFTRVLIQGGRGKAGTKPVVENSRWVTNPKEKAGL
jgi:hypothetical protein